MRSEYLRSVTRQNRISYHTRLANIPFLCAVNTMLVLSSLVHGKPTHPMVSSRMPCTPLRVCAPSPASQSGLAPSSMLSATVLVHRKPTRTHTPCGQLKDAVHSPTSVRTIPCFPIRASTIIDVKRNCTGSPQTNSHTHTPCGQLKDAVHSPTSVRTISRFPIRAGTIINVKCNCTGSPQTNLHTNTHPLWSAQGCRALPYECAHHPPLPNPG